MSKEEYKQNIKDLASYIEALKLSQTDEQKLANMINKVINKDLI
jgi:hypothetical protein